MFQRREEKVFITVSEKLISVIDSDMIDFRRQKWDEKKL